MSPPAKSGKMLLIHPEVAFRQLQDARFNAPGRSHLENQEFAETTREEPMSRILRMLAAQSAFLTLAA